MKPYYQDNFTTIYHADSAEILPQLDFVDLVLTDPPYGINEAAGKNKSRGKLAIAKDYGNDSWDKCIISDDLMRLVLGAGKNIILFGGNFYQLNKNSCWLIWDKKNGESDFADCEIAWTTLPGAVRRIEYLWHGMIKKKPEDRYHPTQKPLDVMTWCIRTADQKAKNLNFSILDPFMGSGTTLVAAKNLNRKAIGIELEEKYCEAAAKRLQQDVFNFETKLEPSSN